MCPPDASPPEIFSSSIYFPTTGKQKNAMLANLALGDTILTSSGFYGVIIDIEEDTVIVEFGSNRNCRIPMQKSAIQAVEKPEDATEDAWENDKKK